MAAEQGKPNKGWEVCRVLFSYTLGQEKQILLMQQGFIFSFVPLLPRLSFSPLVKPQEAAAPGCLEERADSA